MNYIFLKNYKIMNYKARAKEKKKIGNIAAYT